jgi:hypothetical protein
VIPGNVHSPKGSLSLCLFSSSLSVSNLFLLEGGRKGNFYFVARNTLFSPPFSSCPNPSTHMFMFFLTFVQYVRPLLHRPLSNQLIVKNLISCATATHIKVTNLWRSFTFQKTDHSGCRIRPCTGSFITIFAIAHRWTLFWGQLNPVHTHTPCLSKISFINMPISPEWLLCTLILLANTGILWIYCRFDPRSPQQNESHEFFDFQCIKKLRLHHTVVC